MTKKILVVDDEDDIVLLISGRLKASGYEVSTAGDGLKALDMARELRPDLIIMDVMMPKMDGFRVCRMIKFDQTMSDIPVLLLTARGQESDKDTGKAVGADAYVTKPFDAVNLLETVQKMLGD